MSTARSVHSHLRRLSRRHFALSAAALALAGCAGIRRAPDPSRAAGPGLPSLGLTRRDTLVVALAPEAPLFDPFLQVPSSGILRPIVYERAAVSDRNGSTRGELVLGGTAERDGVHLELKVRQGVQFHSGAALDAPAVAGSIERARDPARGGALSAAFGIVEAVEVLSDDTIRVTVERPAPDFIPILSRLFIVGPNEAQQRAGVDGTGPFAVDDYRPGDRTVLRKVPNHWRGDTIPFDRIVVREYRSVEAALVALENGAAHVAPNVGYRHLQTVRPPLQISQAPLGKALYALVLNPRHAPLAGADVRRALARAIDRDRIAKQFGEQTRSADHLIAWQAPPVPIELDRRSAIQALSDLPSGVPRSVTVAVPEAPIEFAMIARLIAQDFDAVGISTAVVRQSVAQWYAAYQSGRFQAVLATVDRAHGHPHELTESDSLRLAGNPVFPDGLPDELGRAFEATLAGYDPKQQAAAATALHRVLLENAWVVPIVWKPALAVLSADVDGLRWTSEDEPDVTGIRWRG